MIYPMILLYAAIVLVAEAAKKMRSTQVLHGRVRRLAGI
jgi:hypothetical protein